MFRLLVQRAKFQGREVDLRVSGGRISRLSPSPLTPLAGEETVDAAGLVLAPAFYNGHTHAAMSLLRGYADDRPLMDWLRNHVWPAEARLSEEIVYAGARLAMLEMIRSGTVFCNDMYWHAPAVARAADEMGLRAAVSLHTVETGGPGRDDPRNVADKLRLRGLPRAAAAGRVFATVAPHAIYTVCERTLRTLAAQARDEGAFIHMHVAETRGEVADCRREHGGRTPVRYLADLGLVGPRSVFAHCVHLTDDDVKILSDRGATLVHNAQSNLKLDSGFFGLGRVHAAGCRVILGTDGCASNNSLSMFGEMKTAALLAKTVADDPTVADAAMVYRMATKGGAEAFGLDAGEIAEGRLADFLLLDGRCTYLNPGHGLVSDLVYAADSSCVDTVVCAGRVLMRRRVVPREDEILQAARQAAARLCPPA
ncbi:MAG: amidohydrolase [Kiritimatiellia bacterium]